MAESAGTIQQRQREARAIREAAASFVEAREHADNHGDTLEFDCGCMRIRRYSSTRWKPCDRHRNTTT